MSLFYTSANRHGNNILFRGYHNGKPVSKKIPYKPTLFILSPKEEEYRTLQNQYVAPIQPGSMNDCYHFIEQYKGVENFPIYGTQNYVHQFLSDNFTNSCSWDISLINIVALDIEVESDHGFPQPDVADKVITAITMYSSLDKLYHVWGLGDYDKTKTVLKDIHIDYVKCEDELELLKRFIAHWEYRYPDIITGWNTRMFDLVYIINRIKRIMGEDYLRISPWKIISENNIAFKGKTNQVYEIIGIQQLDYYDLFKKFGVYTYGPQESYKLDYIASVVLGEKKIDYSEYSSLNVLYKKDHQKFIDYNIRDTQIIERFEDKMGLIALCLTISYKGLVNYSEAFGPVNLWDALIYNELKKKNYVVPPKKFQTKERGIIGAWVKPPTPKVYDWVCSFDVGSLYPSLIMQFNMSPETIVPQVNVDVTIDKLLDGMEIDIPSNYCMAATGQYFSIEKKGFFPIVIEKMFGERSLYKKEMLVKENLLEEIDKEINKRKMSNE